MDLLYSIPQAGSGARAQNRLAGWAGGAGWLAGLAGLAGLQRAVCSVPEDSVPFGRGPAGCGAAAKTTKIYTFIFEKLFGRGQRALKGAPQARRELPGRARTSPEGF